MRTHIVGSGFVVMALVVGAGCGGDPAAKPEELVAEAAARTSTDATLASRLDAEESARRAGDTSLQSLLDAEVAARKMGDADAVTAAKSYADGLAAAAAKAHADLEMKVYADIADEATARAAEVARLDKAIGALAKPQGNGELHLYGPMGEDLGVYLHDDVAHADDANGGTQTAWATEAFVYFDKANCWAGGGSPFLYLRAESPQPTASLRYVAGDGRLVRTVGVRRQLQPISYVEPSTGACEGVPQGTMLLYPATDTGKTAKRVERTTLVVKRAPVI